MSLVPPLRYHLGCAGGSCIAHSPQRPSSPVKSTAQVYARSYVESLRTVSNRHAEFSHDRPISASRQREDIDHVGNAEIGAIPIAAAPGRNSQTNEDSTFWRRPTIDEIHRQPHQSLGGFINICHNDMNTLVASILPTFFPGSPPLVHVTGTDAASAVHTALSKHAHACESHVHLAFLVNSTRFASCLGLT